MTKNKAGTAVVLPLCAVLLVSCGDVGRSSRIIVKELKFERMQDGIIKVINPLASVPKPRDLKGKDIIEGRIVQIPYEPDNPSSRTAVALLKDSELIILTNIPYVNSLGYLYLNREVRLVGVWGKQAVIYGREYKAFRVEDFELMKQTGKDEK